MKAVGYRESLAITEPEALLDIELAAPIAQGHDLLVAIKAVSVNPVDSKIRQRSSPSDGGFQILGFDASAVVVAVGDKVSLFKEGDAVYYAGDMTRSGSNAQYQLVDERLVGRKPQSISDTEAAAMPLTSITAWELLFDRLQLPCDESGRGQQLLIVGAAGGVGSMAVQLAKKLTQMTVIATASRPESQQWVKALGADYVIDHHAPLAPQLQQLGCEKVTHIASLTHTETYFEQLAALIEPQGKIALIDDPVTPLDIMLLKRKSVSLHWELMFTRSLFQTDDQIKQHQLLNRVAEMVDQGLIKATNTDSFGIINAHNVKRAHQAIETGTTIGKIVLTGFCD